MNYRHDFHAGNFADVFKHIFLTRTLRYLAFKPAAFRVIDTHAGSGVYDLSGPEAERSAEWRDGIGRLAAATLTPTEQGLLEPYLRIVTPLLGGDPKRYPGSPWIARALLRPQDKMLSCELHPRARRSLQGHLGADLRIRIIEIDGYLGLKAFIPPVERRGLVLVDPPFEATDEFAFLAGGVEAAWKKWRTGVYLLWYPAKPNGDVEGFMRALVAAGLKKMLRLELQIDAPKPRGPLARSGLIVINPPFQLEAEARIILPCLQRCLAAGEGHHKVEQLAPE